MGGEGFGPSFVQGLGVIAEGVRSFGDEGGALLGEGFDHPLPHAGEISGAVVGLHPLDRPGVFLDVGPLVSTSG